ncbi:hypothetical protein LINGRAHAP2_LOCUS28184, partial [Linum grandiflorum]
GRRTPIISVTRSLIGAARCPDQIGIRQGHGGEDHSAESSRDHPEMCFPVPSVITGEHSQMHDLTSCISRPNYLQVSVVVGFKADSGRQSWEHVQIGQVKFCEDLGHRVRSWSTVIDTQKNSIVQARHVFSTKSPHSAVALDLESIVCDPEQSAGPLGDVFLGFIRSSLYTGVGWILGGPTQVLLVVTTL